MSAEIQEATGQEVNLIGGGGGILRSGRMESCFGKKNEVGHSQLMVRVQLYL